MEYIFSDKTGTLTCNIMEFKKFSTVQSSFEITKLQANNAAQVSMDSESITQYQTNVARPDPNSGLTTPQVNISKEPVGIYNIAQPVDAQTA